MGVEHPFALLLLPLALLPLLRPAARPIGFTWNALLPRDPLSSLAGGLVRTLGALAVAALALAIAGLHRSEETILRAGQGAEIVLLLDRSRSMDDAFATGRAVLAPGREGSNLLVDGFSANWSESRRESKGRTARRLLGDFAAGRAADRFALVVFSTLPMPVLDFTDKPEVIQAAIAAGEVGRGLAETDIGRALESAVALFDRRPYLGSRVVLLVSDGGAQIDEDTRARIRERVRSARVSLYWIYIRSYRSPGLTAEAGDSAAAQTVPERFLHAFFQSLGTPYRAFQAEDPEALKQAIDAVDKLATLPITWADLVPRRDLSGWCYGVALACCLLLTMLRALELRSWADA